MTIKRYDLEWFGRRYTSTQSMCEAETGDYVTYDDHIESLKPFTLALKARIALNESNDATDRHTSEMALLELRQLGWEGEESETPESFVAGCEAKAFALLHSLKSEG